MESFGRKPYTDYRDSVPFMDLSGYICNLPKTVDEKPAESIKMQLFKKRCSIMINLRRLRYRAMCEAYRNGRC